MSSATTALVFVYGTLRRGGSNHFRMEGCRWLGEATVRGRLYRVDWYPALQLDEEAGEVAGDLFEAPLDQLPQLDDYEGEEYRRVLAAVTNAEGQAVEASLWEWRQETEGLQRVIGGDWLAADPG